MKLFSIKYMSYHDDYSVLMVAKSKLEVLERALKLDDQCYSVVAEEITEVDGYKIELSK